LTVVEFGDERKALLLVAPEPEARARTVTAPSRSSAMTAADVDVFRRYRLDRDPALREHLVTRFLPLARHLARRYQGQAERDDLEQVAAFGLLKAIDRFDPDRGLAFTSFAVPTVVGELKRHFRDRSWSVHVPRSVKELKVRVDAETRTLGAELGRSPTAVELADRIGTTVELVVDALAARTAHRADSLDRPLSEDGETALELLGGENDPGYSQSEDAMLVSSLLATLPDREQTILRLRFQQELTQAEIAERIGVSQMHVSRLIRKSITRLSAVAQQA
jgi:RNA polymerase sigma-B factor